MKVNPFDNTSLYNASLVYGHLTAEERGVDSDLVALYLLGQTTEKEKDYILNQAGDWAEPVAGCAKDAEQECEKLGITDAKVLRSILTVLKRDPRRGVFSEGDVPYIQDQLVRDDLEGAIRTLRHVFNREVEKYRLRPIGPADHAILDLFEKKLALVDSNERDGLASREECAEMRSLLRKQLQVFVHDLQDATDNLNGLELHQTTALGHEEVDPSQIRSLGLLIDDDLEEGIELWLRNDDMAGALDAWMYGLSRKSREYAILKSLHERAKQLPEGKSIERRRLGHDMSVVGKRLRALLDQRDSLAERLKAMPNAAGRVRGDLKILLDDYQDFIGDMLKALEGDMPSYLAVAQHAAIAEIYQKHFDTHLSTENAVLLLNQLKDSLSAHISTAMDKPAGGAWLNQPCGRGAMRKREWIQKLIENPHSALLQAYEQFSPMDSEKSTRLTLTTARIPGAYRDLTSSTFHDFIKEMNLVVKDALGLVC